MIISDSQSRPYAHACGFDSLLAPHDDDEFRLRRPTVDVFARWLALACCYVCLCLRHQR